MAGTSDSASPTKATSGMKIRVRYGRLSLAVLGLLAIAATLVGAVLAPFTALTFGWVLAFLVVGIASFATLRVMAVRDRNRRLLAHLEATRQAAMRTAEQSAEEHQVINRSSKQDEVFDARPGSARRAPAITAEELRAEALRVAQGRSGVKQPETWAPTEVPVPTYVKVRESTQREIAARVRPEPLPVSEPLRPSKSISLKASEDAKRIAAEVADEDKAAVASLSEKLAPAASAPAQKPETTQSDVKETVADGDKSVQDEAPVTPKPQTANRLNLDAVMQRRRA